MSESISKDEAVAALRGVAFRVTHREDSAYGRTLVHCFRGWTGADWDLERAIKVVEESDRILWTSNPFEHELRVIRDGETYDFNVKRPAEVPEHLVPVESDRGFKRLPAIPSEYGGDVRVYESSAASGPHVWLTATAPSILGRPDVPTVEAAMHFTVENALALSDQLRYLVQHHYQGAPE